MQEKDQQNPLLRHFLSNIVAKSAPFGGLPVNGPGIDKRSSCALSKIDSCFAMIED